MTRKKTKNFLPPTMGDGSDDIQDLECLGDGPTETTQQDRFAAQVLGVFQPNEEFDRARTDANVELIQLVAQFVTDHPSMRFGQVLSSLELATPDVALVEPQVQLNRAKAAIRRMKR